MHMGMIDPVRFPQKTVLKHFGENYIYSIIFLPLMGAIAHFAAVLLGITTPGLLLMVVISLLAGILVVTAMNLLGYYTAVITYRKGFDPDNFGVPVVTSSIDLIGATCLLAVMMILL